ncbi:hypothetical protein NHQ30_001769 [Ciborinia camelliae]|nr:hypothetical protein NHQ30_001769 [Ciborinia camelliae]
MLHHGKQALSTIRHLSTESIHFQHLRLKPFVQAQGVIQSSTMASTFTCFSRLPVELQLHILELNIIVSEPRTLHLSLQEDSRLGAGLRKHGINELSGAPIFLNRRPVPAALQVCQKFRTKLFVDSHKLFFKATGVVASPEDLKFKGVEENWVTSFYFDYKFDTLRFDPELWEGKTFRMQMVKDTISGDHGFHKFTRSMQADAFTEFKTLDLCTWYDDESRILGKTVISVNKKWFLESPNKVHLTDPEKREGGQTMVTFEQVKWDVMFKARDYRLSGWRHTMWNYELMVVEGRKLQIELP